MKGVILAGGSGSRLYPLTRITNKHLLPVYNQPMVYYPIQLLVECDIDRILIVTGGNHAGEFLPLLGNGSAFGLKHLDYTHQERAAGIADALALARHFVGGDDVCVLLADNIFEFSIRPTVERFEAQGGGARVILAGVDHPEHYGVPVFRDGRIEVVKGLQPSARGELEITDVNNAYLRRGRLQHDVIDGYWADCGESFDSLLRANVLVKENGANKPVTEPARLSA